MRTGDVEVNLLPIPFAVDQRDAFQPFVSANMARQFRRHQADINIAEHDPAYVSTLRLEDEIEVLAVTVIDQVKISALILSVTCTMGCWIIRVF